MVTANNTANRYHAYVIDVRGTEQHISFPSYERYLQFEADCRNDWVRIVRSIMDAEVN